MIENKKIKNILKNALISITCAFIGPILFVLGFGQDNMDTTQYILITLGGLFMLNTIIFGVLAIKKILSGFFEDSNE